MTKKRPKRDPKKLTIDVIEARAIVIVDEFGNERATLSCSVGRLRKQAVHLVGYTTSRFA